MNNIRGIVIDPGHGGDDPGAIGNGIVEKDYTLKISKYMYDRLNELGIPVYITRDSDITLSPNERVDRVKNAFGSYKDVIVVSNHINAGSGDGAEVIYALRNDSTLSNNILSKLAQAGQNIRGAYQRKSMVNPSKDYYFMQRNTSPLESITIEYGFLDSTKDDVSQLKNNWQMYAEAAVQGILNYINKNTNIDNNVYIVKAGDSLYQIANKYNTTVEELKSINNLTTDNLYIGQQLLLVPTNNTDNNIYVVKLGDTLYSIAKRYNIPVQDIIDNNDIVDNIIVVGQQLIIPSNNDYYIVKAGDTLYSIARKYNTTVEDIMNKNNLSNTILSIGQKLKI